MRIPGRTIHEHDESGVGPQFQSRIDSPRENTPWPSQHHMTMHTPEACDTPSTSPAWTRLPVAMHRQRKILNIPPRTSSTLAERMIFDASLGCCTTLCHPILRFMTFNLSAGQYPVVCAIVPMGPASDTDIQVVLGSLPNLTLISGRAVVGTGSIWLGLLRELSGPAH